MKEALEWCRMKNNMPFFETSAKDGTNVEKAFVHMAENHVDQVSCNGNFFFFERIIKIFSYSRILKHLMRRF
jgi:hypothetical protein